MLAPQTTNQDGPKKLFRIWPMALLIFGIALTLFWFALLVLVPLRLLQLV